jgi:hypothetical protein
MASVEFIIVDPLVSWEISQITLVNWLPKETILPLSPTDLAASHLASAETAHYSHGVVRRFPVWTITLIDSAERT